MTHSFTDWLINWYNDSIIDRQTQVWIDERKNAFNINMLNSVTWWCLGPRPHEPFPECAPPPIHTPDQWAVTSSCHCRAPVEKNLQSPVCWDSGCYCQIWGSCCLLHIVCPGGKDEATKWKKKITGVCQKLISAGHWDAFSLKSRFSAEFQWTSW